MLLRRTARWSASVPFEHPRLQLVFTPTLAIENGNSLKSEQTQVKPWRYDLREKSTLMTSCLLAIGPIRRIVFDRCLLPHQQERLGALPPTPSTHLALCADAQASRKPKKKTPDCTPKPADGVTREDCTCHADLLCRRHDLSRRRGLQFQFHAPLRCSFRVQVVFPQYVVCQSTGPTPPEANLDTLSCISIASLQISCAWPSYLSIVAFFEINFVRAPCFWQIRPMPPHMKCASCARRTNCRRPPATRSRRQMSRRKAFHTCRTRGLEGA